VAGCPARALLLIPWPPADFRGDPLEHLTGWS
jgi:hypothetical protein